MVDRTVVLASQSQQRQELFTALGIPFTVTPADIDELAINHADHGKRAELVAVAKAEKILNLHPTAIVVSADTFVLLHGKRLEKPVSREEATKMLNQLSASTFIVYTGWAVLDGLTQMKKSGTVTINVTFRTLSPIEVEQYVSVHPVTTWAGGFSIKNAAGIALVSKIDGSLTGLLGLPIEVIQPVLHSTLGSESGV